MKWIAVGMILFSSVLAEEGPEKLRPNIVVPLVDGSAESRTGGAKFQLDFFVPDPGPPPSDECSARHSENVDVNWVPGQELGFFQGVGPTGNVFLDCTLETFSEEVAHANCPGVGSDPFGIDPEDPILGYTQFNRTFSFFNLDGLGTVPAGSYSFKLNSGFEFTDHQPSELRINYQGVETTKILQPCALAPLIVAGDFSDYRISSRLLVTNTARWAVEASYQFEDAAGGGPTDVRVWDVVNSMFEWELPAGTTRAWEIFPAQEGGQFIGYLNLCPKDQSVQEQVVAVEYLTFQRPFEPQGATETLVGQSGVEASGMGTFHSLNVRKDASGADTGIVLLNPTAVDADLTLLLFDTEDTQVAQAQLELLGGRLFSRFALEYFGLEEMESFNGTAVVSSNVDISSLSLRTWNGIQQGSLPSGVAGIP